MKVRSRFPPLIAIDRRLAEPLQRQIYGGYREAILDGRIAPGERLPSTRGLAAELGISRVPVVEAFDQLLAEGYCESRVGAGTFVARDLPERPARPTRQRPRDDAGGGRGPAAPRPGARRIARASATLDRPPSPWLGQTGPFHLGDAAFDRFPFEVWASLLRRHSRQLKSTALRYAASIGLPALREAIAEYLGAARGLRASAAEIVVVSGSQQALFVAAQALLDRGDAVWHEEPGYWGARDALRAVGATIVPVPVDDEGIDVERGRALAPAARAVFVTPSHQFPLGATMSASRRLQLLEWARKSGAWIVEDDYDSDYRYESTPVASLQGLDRDARVIYIGTFSKVLFGGLRLGYLVLPPDLVQRFVTVRRVMDICPPSITQAVLADFLAEGHFVRHLKRMRPVYRERRQALAEALARELGGDATVSGEAAGMHLVALLRAGLRDRPIAERAARERIWTLPLSGCYVGPEPRQGLVLGYGGAGPAEIRSAVRHLREIVESS